MKTRISYILITGLMLLNFTWIFSVLQKNGKLKEHEASFREFRYRSDRAFHLAQKGRMSALATDQQVLSDHLLIPLKKNHSISFREAIGRSARLVLFVSNTHCDSCVEEVLYQLKRSLTPEDHPQIMVVFYRGVSSPEFWWSRQMILPGAGFFEISQNGLGLPLDSLDAPYLFVSGPDLHTRMSFSPYPPQENELGVYLNLIIHQFFQIADNE